MKRKYKNYAEFITLATNEEWGQFCTYLRLVNKYYAHPTEDEEWFEEFKQIMEMPK